MATPGSPVRDDGTVVQWRIAGVEHAAAEPCVPFVIEWGEGTSLPGHAAGSVPGRLERVRLSGDEARLAEWLGRSDAALYTIRPGRSAVTAVDVVTAFGERVSIGA